MSTTRYNGTHSLALSGTRRSHSPKSPNRFWVLMPALLTVATWCAQPVHALPISGSVTVKPWSVSPAGNVTDPNIGLDIQYANKIYEQVGITVNSLANGNIAALPPGGAGTTWTDAGNAITGNTGLFGNNMAGAVNMYYLPSYTAFGQAWANEDVPGNSSAVGLVVTQPTAVMGTPANNAGPRRNDTIAHELGHVLTNNWRWRAAEQFPGQSFHSGNYAAATSPYVNNTGGNNMMAAGSVRNTPTALNQVAPTGNVDLIDLNIGQNNGNAPNANQATFQISSLFNNNTQIANLARDNITATVGATTTAPFGWGVPQTIGNVIVNEAARLSSPFANNTATETLMFHYRAGGAGVFVQGGGLVLGFGDIDAIKYNYTGAGALSVMTVDDILTNPGNFTTLTAGANYNSAVNFTGTKLTNGTVTFTNLPAGQKDILVMLSMTIVPEPGGLVLSWFAVAAVGLFHRRRRVRRTTLSPRPIGALQRCT